MVARSVEAKIDLAQGVAQSGAIELIAARELRILDMLVSDHFSGTLDGLKALVGIARIADLRQLRTEMKRAVTQGTQAGHSLTETK